MWNQTNQDFEIIKVEEKGELAKLRNEGAKRAKGEILCFIDDDVVCDKGWYEAIVKAFNKDSTTGGVSGPAYISKEYRANRDIFKLRILHELFTGMSNLPGHISRAGAWTTGACEESCNYEGEVQFLEACNMVFRSDVFYNLSGFDTNYKGIGDWSEPDLSFRIRRAGYQLWFSRDARLEHRPSKSGAFKKRSADSWNRKANYELFSNRWIKPCWQHSFYKWMISKYYEYKAIK